MRGNRVAGGGARRIAAALSAIAIAVALTACGGSSSEGEGGATELVNGLPFDVTNWDVATGGDESSSFYHQAVYASLFTLNPDLSVAPSLATEWSYDDTNTALTLTLAPDLTFTDGTALDADAVKANLERSRDINGPQTVALSSIQDISVTSPTDLVIQLDEPDPGLLFNLARAPGMIVSPAAFETAKVTPVGAGPYVLDADESKPGSEYVLTRNPDYAVSPEFGFDRLVFKVLAFDALLPAVSSGQIDVAGVFPDSLQTVRDAGLETVVASGFITGFYLLDRGGELVPALGDVRVRQAINYAVDSERLLQTMEDGAGFRTTQMFAKGTDAYIEELNKRYPYDPEKAKELLTEAGYPDGFSVTIPASGSSPMYAVLQEQLAQVGIEIVYDTVGELEAFETLVSGDYAIVLAEGFAPSNNWIDASNLMMPGGAFNPFETDDPVVTGLMAEIAVSDEATQGELFKELNTYVVEQAWFAPRYIVETYFAYDGSVVSFVGEEGSPVAELSDFQPAEG